MLAPGHRNLEHEPAPDPNVADPVTASVPELGPGGHLSAVDAVRFVTVAGVILVHATALTVSYGSVAAGGVYVVAHVTRSVFLLLSAFVLTYSFDRRPVGARAFWRKRYPLIVVPYATWSLIYILTGGDLGSVQRVVTSFLEDLITGNAHFHLYFLLLTMQLYAVFPAIMAVLRRWPGVLLPALAVSLGFELAVNALIHYGTWPPALSIWLGNAGAWLLTYPLYVIMGVAAARNFSKVTTWVRRHSRLVVLSWFASVGVALGSYLLDLRYLGYSPLKASEVFQPALVLETVTATAAQYVLGMWLGNHLSVRHLRRLERSSDVSFGVYLAHPLLISAILDVAGFSGLWHRLGGLPSGLGEAMVAFGLVPFVYAATFLATSAARRTAVSLALTGRRRLADPAPTRGAGRAARCQPGVNGRPSADGPDRAAERSRQWTGPMPAPPRRRASLRRGFPP